MNDDERFALIDLKLEKLRSMLMVIDRRLAEVDSVVNFNANQTRGAVGKIGDALNGLQKQIDGVKFQPVGRVPIGGIWS